MVVTQSWRSSGCPCCLAAALLDSTHPNGCKRPRQIDVFPLVCWIWSAADRRPADGGQDETSWESAAMDQSDPNGAFGATLARYYHQSESKTAVISWPELSTFAITR